MLLIAVFIKFGKHVVIETTWKVMRASLLWDHMTSQKHFNFNFISAKAAITNLEEPIAIENFNHLRLIWADINVFNEELNH